MRMSPGGDGRSEPRFNAGAELHKVRELLDHVKNTTVLRLPRQCTLFSQGDGADSLYYVRAGLIRLVASSDDGQETVIDLPGPGAFFGESCLAGYRNRNSTAITITPCVVSRLPRESFVSSLREEPLFVDLVLMLTLSGAHRREQDLAYWRFHSIEKRLAAVLLRIAESSAYEGPPECIGRISQETLAKITGTTRSRVSFAMNRFRERGVVRYKSSIEVDLPALRMLVKGADEEIRLGKERRSRD